MVQLIAESQRRLYAYVMTLVVNPSDADDVLQETNVVLWEKADQFHLPEESEKAVEQFMAWASKIAYFQSLARLKRHQRDRLRFDDALLGQLAETAADRMAVFDDQRIALLSCVEKLSEKDRALIKCRYDEETDPQSMAEKFGRTRHAINQALYRIRNTLTDCVKRTLSQRGVS